MIAEHERPRARGTPRMTLSDALALTGGAAAAVREVTEGLQVHPERMRENLDATGGLLLAENLTTVASERLGRLKAHDLVQAARGGPPMAGSRFARSFWETMRFARFSPRRRSTPRSTRQLSRIGGDLVDRALALYRKEERYDRADHRRAAPRARRSEDAPVLVMANSLGTTLRMWDDQAPELRERFRLLRYDHRGHGGSPVPPGLYEIEDLGRDALALFDRLGIERFSFCGLSIGGMVGMWLASEAPERVERLVLCCTSALLGRESSGTSAYGSPRGRAWTPSWTASSCAGSPRSSSPAIPRSEKAARMLRETNPEGYAGCCAAIRDMDLRSRLFDNGPDAGHRGSRGPRDPARARRAHPRLHPWRGLRGRAGRLSPREHRAARGRYARDPRAPGAGRRQGR